LTIVSPWIIVRTVLVCVALGSLYGFVLPGGGPSFFNFVIPYFVGALSGKLVHKIAGYKLGKKVVTSIVSGLLVGMILSPISSNLYYEIYTLVTAPNYAIDEMTGIVCTIGPAAIFVFGVLSPIIYGYSRRS
jgi:hypothetical protein